MSSLNNTLSILLLVATALALILYFGYRYVKAAERAHAQKLLEAEQPLDVWLCRNCGFVTLLKNLDCTWCKAPRPDDFLFRKISPKEFADQVRKPMPKPYADCSDQYA